MRARHLATAVVAVTAVLGAPVAAYSARTSAPASAPQRAVADDTLALAQLLGTARGAHPLFCELMTRMIDGRSYWSSAGRGNLVEMDGSASDMIRWIHARHEDPRLVPRLAASMRDADPCVRRVGGGMLGRVRHPSARGALLDALDDASASTREVAAIGIGLQEDSVAVQPLIARLRDSAAPVRRSAAWALGIGFVAGVLITALARRGQD